mmetsp:Transcript_11302/g.28627  ORF Transcript_11302/g.28627 Transcript_11302/m.28627 type:complete len:131 (+) Transcript_11302:32-424(+)
MDSRCARRVATGATVGGSLGAAIGAVYGTYEAFRYKVGCGGRFQIGQTLTNVPVPPCRLSTDSWALQSEIHRTNDLEQCCDFWLVLGCWVFLAVRQESRRILIRTPRRGTSKATGALRVRSAVDLVLANS